MFFIGPLKLSILWILHKPVDHNFDTRIRLNEYTKNFEIIHPLKEKNILYNKWESEFIANRRQTN